MRKTKKFGQRDTIQYPLRPDRGKINMIGVQKFLFGSFLFSKKKEPAGGY